MNQLNQNSINWSLMFTNSRGHRLLHDVRLLPKPSDPEEYAKELWKIMTTVNILFIEQKTDKFSNLISFLEND